MAWRLTFEMSGMNRLAGAWHLDRRVSRHRASAAGKELRTMGVGGFPPCRQPRKGTIHVDRQTEITVHLARASSRNDEHIPWKKNKIQFVLVPLQLMYDGDACDLLYVSILFTLMRRAGSKRGYQVSCKKNDGNGKGSKTLVLSQYDFATGNAFKCVFGVFCPAFRATNRPTCHLQDLHVLRD